MIYGRDINCVDLKGFSAKLTVNLLDYGFIDIAFLSSGLESGLTRVSL